MRATAGHWSWCAARRPSYTETMKKSFRLVLLASCCLAPVLATAQWIWVDKDGHKVFSDRAPPAEVVPARILKQPGVRGTPADAAASPVASAAPAAGPGNGNGKPNGTDSSLEQRRKQAEAAQAQKKKDEEAKLASIRADNCSRAKTARAGLQSGSRVAYANAKGETEIMDDARRAEEIKRLDDVINRDCAIAQ